MRDRTLALNRLGQRLHGIAARRPLFLDTETTGTGPDGRVVEITILAPDGRVLFNSLINPEVPIPAAASAVHGITADLVRNAPPWPEIDAQVAALLNGHTVVTYNAEFDRRMIGQTRQVYRLPPQRAAWYCLMKGYAFYHGDLHPIHQTYSYQKLVDAMAQMQLTWPENLPAHRAAADVEAARRLFWHLVERLSNGHRNTVD